MKKVILFSIILGMLQEVYAQQPIPGFNQSGYLPAEAKEAMVASAEGTTFFLLNENGTDTVFRGELGAWRASPVSELNVRLADFSAVQTPGQYWLVAPGYVRQPITIGADVYIPLSKASLKGFYFQRSDMVLEEKYAGRWARPSGHADTKVQVHPSAANVRRPAGTIITSPGGWYDAGDYNKYIVNSGVTMGTLFSAYEDFHHFYDTLQAGIPETGNAIPDLLDEALYNLRWMMTMQDPDDGGVYHKCTDAVFDGMVMPGFTKATRYVVQKSTAATLDFAATMAQASRIFRSFSHQLPGLADSCLQAAQYAWKWASQFPNILYEQEKMNQLYKPAVTTGGYGDNMLGDEWFWAAAELYVTTQQPQYVSVLKKNISTIQTVPSWPQVGMLGIFSLLRHSSVLPDLSLLVSARKQLMQLADTLLAGRTKSLSHTIMGARPGDFIWGSSAVAANQGMLLINAYLQTKERKYFQAALSNLDYLLGKNATGYSFITGEGVHTPMHPHHRPSAADNIEMPVPGLLVGGPNASASRQDKCEYLYMEPERQYTDKLCSYASNEIAINWNAPLVYLSGAVCALR